ncbi:MAG: FAD-dependent oxidoreductase [Calditrichaceae bacterium]|nr:FAD-dependent oxidoreductase [Calditrichaceae bacterium]MBN2707881.1 FAD-dependent oxidoreductase [Calditrichaceae bacterium]RQV97829.1 MAG: hypothetical protein EH224_00030 [Calditrichota bacterium]
MKPGYYIAIFGGAVAGSEAASELNANGIRTVVFDQNALPYGKLESGLPKWHYKLRDRQEEKIDEKLAHSLSRFVPNVKLGEDVDFKDIYDHWGFTAILLATGAWRDRPLPVAGIDSYINKGLYYMNALVNWFNHNHDPDSGLADMDIADGAIIIGGGLASLDVAKIVLIESVRNALKERGIIENALTIEHQGVVKILEDHGLSLEKLGLKGCRLFTRHSITGMPLTSIPEDAPAEEVEKAMASREKILAKVQEKFPFEIIPNMAPVDKIIRDGRLTGIVFEKTQEKDGKFTNIPGSRTEVETPLVISAIGSIPEHIPGIPMKGEIYDVENIATGKIRGLKNVFALGNAVTGRGNIRQSQMHSRQVSESIVDQYLAWKEEDYKEIFDSAENRVAARIGSILEALRQETMLSAEQIGKIETAITDMQKPVKYDGQYQAWIKTHLPPRLENQTDH